MSRRPVVEGQFYPAEPEQLRAAIESFTPQVSEKERALGLLSPHAGYVFSGSVAGRTFARIKVPDVVLLLTPSHSYSHPPFAVWTGGSWLTPLGDITLHEGLTGALLEVPQVVANDKVHLPEHSGEVVVPFIQYHNPAAQLAVMCVTASADLVSLKEVGTALPEAFRKSSLEDVLIVASSDMSHESGSDALDVVNHNDQLAIEQMEKLSPDGLYRVCRQQGVTMCGVLPAVVMMSACAAMGAKEGVLVARATSADSPFGGGSYVVGYAGMIFR